MAEGSEAGAGEGNSSLLLSSAHKLSPMYSSDLRNLELRGKQGQSAVTFESLRKENSEHTSPLPGHLAALKQQLEKQKLKDFASPTNLRSPSADGGGSNDLDLSTPMQVLGGDDPINRCVLDWEPHIRVLHVQEQAVYDTYTHTHLHACTRTRAQGFRILV